MTARVPDLHRRAFMAPCARLRKKGVIRGEPSVIKAKRGDSGHGVVGSFCVLLVFSTNMSRRAFLVRSFPSRAQVETAYQLNSSWLLYYELESHVAIDYT